MGASGKEAPSCFTSLTKHLMSRPNDLSRSLTPFVQGSTLVAVIELSLSSWLVAGLVPGVARQPLKKLDPDEAQLLRLLQRWRDEAVRSGCTIEHRCRLRGWTRRLLDGALVADARDRGSCDPFHERGRLARAPAGKDQPAGHRDVAARVHGLAAGRAWALRDGRRSDDRRGGRQAAKPRAGKPGRRADADCQPDEGGADPARHSRLQAGTAPSTQEAGRPSNARGSVDPAEHPRRDPPRPGTAGHGPRADRRDRAGPPDTHRASPGDRAECDGASIGQRRRRGRRDGGHAGPGGAVPQLARPPGGGTLRRPHRFARRERLQAPG